MIGTLIRERQKCEGFCISSISRISIAVFEMLLL